MKALGVVLDRRLSFDRHATSVARACNFHAHALWHIRHLLTTELALTLVCSLILSRLDYCNTVLHCAPDSSIQKLQRVQNTAAQVILQAPRQSQSRVSTTPGTVTLAASSTTHRLQARHPDLQVTSSDTQLLYASVTTSDLGNLHATSMFQPYRFYTDWLPELTLPTAHFDALLLLSGTLWTLILCAVAL